ncbi:M12 family metallopeptidase [Bacillus thuringiensis]|uniref:M12 family metallopeptidase n=1 Tax=Bacillus cereus group TaxID=86661 RepID=UPI00211D32CB|nr:M12 family metallopeptidase [Bacillus thuringiensis]
MIDAISHWKQFTLIRFVERTDESDYVVFEPGDGCSSTVIGRLGGKQYIYLSDNCSTGSIIHEIGHAVGLFHEQCRWDRDNFIKINWGNIIDGYAPQFERGGLQGEDIGPYDYNSIMQYGADAFSKNGKLTIETIPPGIPIGQRNGLSAGDIATVSTLYHGPSWVGDFNKHGMTEVLFFSPSTQEWELGTFTNNKLSWNLAGNTANFGQVGDGRPIWIGDFNGDDKMEVLFYFPGDQTWWLGTFTNNELSWNLAGNHLYL